MRAPVLGGSSLFVPRVERCLQLCVDDKAGMCENNNGGGALSQAIRPLSPCDTRRRYRCRRHRCRRHRCRSHHHRHRYRHRYRHRHRRSQPELRHASEAHGVHRWRCALSGHLHPRLRLRACARARVRCAAARCTGVAAAAAAAATPVAEVLRPALTAGEGDSRLPAGDVAPAQQKVWALAWS